LNKDLTETWERFWFPDTTDALKRGDHQNKIHEQTGAKRDEQKDAQTTQSSVGSHIGTKLPENCRAHKRFSFSAGRSATDQRLSSGEVA
jgi:hypothetical protein